MGWGTSHLNVYDPCLGKSRELTAEEIRESTPKKTNGDLDSYIWLVWELRNFFGVRQGEEAWDTYAHVLKTINEKYGLALTWETPLRDVNRILFRLWTEIKGHPNP